MGYNRILPRVGGGGAGGFYNMAKDYSGGAINARSRMQPGSSTSGLGHTDLEAPKKTAGGGIMAALGGAGGGAGVSMALGLSNPYTAIAVGGFTALSTLAYYLG